MNEFASLPLARTYIETVREQIRSFDSRELIDALEHLDNAYYQFPELELDHPHAELLEHLRSAAENAPNPTAIPLLMYCVGSNLSCSSSLVSLLEKIAVSDGWPSVSRVLHLLCRSGEFYWDGIKPIIDVLRQQDRKDVIHQIIAEVLDCIKFTAEESVSELGDTLKYLLGDNHPLGLHSGALAQTVRSARHRLIGPPLGRDEPGWRVGLLAMAGHLRLAPSPALSNPRPDLAWPSGRMSFDEFLLQWPCEIELPVESDDATFVEEAYQAILLRGPDPIERDQYLKLLDSGAVPRSWIIENLLAREELRSLGRRLRVIWANKVITEPGDLVGKDVAAITWPWISAD